MIANQDFATADPVGGTDDPFFFHHLDDPCGPVIADLEMSLDKAGRSFAFAGDQGNGLVIVLVVTFAAGAAAGFAEDRLARIFGDRLQIIRLALFF